MCCFSRAVSQVSDTNLFARPERDGRQILVYSMRFAADGEVAMVLPLPVPRRPAEDAVKFIDLSVCPDLFARLARAFVVEARAGMQPAAISGAPPPRPKLAVHAVGRFEATFVPTLDDFDRLDDRFRLPPGVWGALPAYADWGFAVFKLRAADGADAAAPREVHPMAFSFPRRDPDTLFFPTVHVHDGAVHARAAFDHTLYCQPDARTAATLGWQRAARATGDVVEPERTRGVVDRAAPLFRFQAAGELPNVDVALTPPPCDDLAALSVRRQWFDLRVRATTAYDPFGWSRPAWRETARNGLDRLAAGLRLVLADTTARRAGEWGLAPYDDAAPEHWASANGVVFPPPEAGAPCRIVFQPFTDAVEPQQIRLAFARPPAQEQAAAIQSALASALDRALG